MSTSAAMAGVAASQAAIASAEAQRAKAERCKVEVAKFDNKTATVLEMRSYADCVHTLYPSDLSGDGLIAAKALFVFALLCAIAGGLREARYGWRPGILDVVLFSVLWFFLGPCALLGVLGIFYGIYWVFT